MLKTTKKIALVLLILMMQVLFFCPALKVSAASDIDPDKPLSLTLTLKSSGDDGKVAKGAKVTAYKVAAADVSSGRFMPFLTDDYKDSGLDLDSKIRQSDIDDLADFTAARGLKGVTATSGDDGKVVFTDLDAGIYLVMADELPKGFSSFVPFLYSLPVYDSDKAKWIYDGVAEPKLTYAETVDINVRKVWKDDGDDRPDHITVRLSNGNGKVEDVVLNDANHWKYSWKDLDAALTWDVKEINVPKDYKVSYSAKGYDITITNTKKKPGGTNGKRKKRKKLIQTGQLDYPIAIMGFAGLFLISAGIIVKVTGKKNEE